MRERLFAEGKTSRVNRYLMTISYNELFAHVNKNLDNVVDNIEGEVFEMPL